MLKREFRKPASTYKNGQPMYPGAYVFLWAEIAPGVWSLIEMKPVADEQQKS